MKYNNHEIKAIEILKYLGNKIMTNGTVKVEITERIKNTGKFYQLVRYKLWQWDEMPVKGKMCLYESYFIPILIYETETCTWTMEHVSRLMTVQV